MKKFIFLNIILLFIFNAITPKNKELIEIISLWIYFILMISFIYSIYILLKYYKYIVNFLKHFEKHDDLHTW